MLRDIFFIDFSGFRDEHHKLTPKTQKRIDYSLIALQVLGALLLAAAVPGAAHWIPMPGYAFTLLAISGGLLTVMSSLFWSIFEYPDRNRAYRISIYVLTVIAALTCTFGAMGYYGLLTHINNSVARGILGYGLILSLPLIFPYLFQITKYCCTDNPQETATSS